MKYYILRHIASQKYMGRGSLVCDITNSYFYDSPPLPQPYFEILEVKIKIEGIYEE